MLKLIFDQFCLGTVETGQHRNYKTGKTMWNFFSALTADENVMSPISDSISPAQQQ